MPASIGAAGRGGPRGATVGNRALSVVVITYDESDRIAACLDSIFAASDALEDVEVVVVDSRSTDDTVDVAGEYPVTILRLPPEPPVTPSAGRYVGTAATSGDLVLFVDGDMVLTEGWLEDACRRVRENPAVGGLDGHLNESNGDDERPTDVVRGVALYDRTALEEAGGYDPYLRSLEDIDLSYRLDAEGYRLVRLPTVVAHHPTRDGELERLRRWKNGYYHGRGELFRKYVSRPHLFVRLTYRTRLFLWILAWFGLGAIGTIAAGARAFIPWTVGTVVAFAGVSFHRGPVWTLGKLFATVPVLAGVLLGFPGSHPKRTEYPVDTVETVQTAGDTADTQPARVT